MCIPKYVYIVLVFVVGYGVSIGLGSLFTSWIVEKLRKEYDYEREDKGEDQESKPKDKEKESKGKERRWKTKRLPQFTGILDRILYTTALLMGFKEFIPVWLLVKVARGWHVPSQPEKAPVPRRNVARYNIFFIGNALCVIFGVTGALIIMWLCAKLNVGVPFLNIFAFKQS